MTYLIILNWTLWSALLIALIYALVLILTERSRTPEAGPALGVFLIALGLLFSATTGGLLHRFAQKQSFPGLIIMTLVLAWPLVPLIARPIGVAIKEWKYAHSKSARGNLSAS
jgi:hypothetical protein